MKIFIYILIFLTVFLINCNPDNINQDIFPNDSNKKKEIVVQNLEILDVPHSLTVYPDDNDVNWKPVSIPLIRRMPDPSHENRRSIWIRCEFIKSENHQSSDYYAINLG